MKQICSVNRSGRQASIAPPELPYKPGGQEISVDNVAPCFPYDQYEVYVLRVSDDGTMSVQDPTSFVGPDNLSYPSYALICSPDSSNPSLVKRVLYACLLTGVSLKTWRGAGEDWWRTLSLIPLITPGAGVRPNRVTFNQYVLWNVIARDQNITQTELLFRPAYDLYPPGWVDTGIRKPLIKASWSVNSASSELAYSYYRTPETPSLVRTYPYSSIEGTTLKLSHENYLFDLFALGAIHIGSPERSYIASFGDMVGVCLNSSGGHDIIWVGMHKPAGSNVVKGVLHRSSSPGSHTMTVEDSPAMILAGPWIRA